MKKKFTKEINAGTVSLVILAMLEAAQQPMYGYQIAKALEGRSPPGQPTVKQGTIYPVLRSLHGNGLLQSEVEPSVSGPPRRYYTISDFGRRQLTEWKEIWYRTRDFVDAILEEVPNLAAEEKS